VTDLPALEIDRAVEALRHGGIVVYPTETVYGLGAEAYCDTALERLGALKGGDRVKPVSVLVESRTMLETIVASIPDVAERLMAGFWPGALTIAFRARAGLSPVLTGGGATIAARVSSHPVAQSLVERLGKPITATSANPGGSPPPVEAAVARTYFRKAVDVYLEAGPTPGGPGSSVVDCSGEDLRLVREGAVSVARIEAVARVHLRRR
jgi:L-threonylcarbamoyladenylate synthase